MQHCLPVFWGSCCLHFQGPQWSMESDFNHSNPKDWSSKLIRNQSTRRHIPGNLCLFQLRCKNLQYRMSHVIWILCLILAVRRTSGPQ